MILLNARLVQDPVAVAGVMLRTFRAFEGTLLPVFHLEQFDPEDDKDTRGVDRWLGGLGGIPRWFQVVFIRKGWWVRDVVFGSWGYCNLKGEGNHDMVGRPDPKKWDFLVLRMLGISLQHLCGRRTHGVNWVNPCRANCQGDAPI